MAAALTTFMTHDLHLCWCREPNSRSLMFVAPPRHVCLQVDVKLSVRGNARGRSTEAHHQREQIVEVTVFTLRCCCLLSLLNYPLRGCVCL